MSKLKRTPLANSLLAKLKYPWRGTLLALVLSPVYVVVCLLDLLFRWGREIGNTLTTSRGYVTLGSILAAYLAYYGLIDSRATQDEARASVALNTFVTLVSSDNVTSFVTGMTLFGPTQTMRATLHPSLWGNPFAWGDKYQPNRKALWQWAHARLGQCAKASTEVKAQDCSTLPRARIDLRGVDLRYTYLFNVDLHDANLDGADLTGSDLRRASLDGASLSATLDDADLRFASLGKVLAPAVYLRRADLRHAQAYGIILEHSYLEGANLCGADLSAANLADTYLSGAKYDELTKFPDKFDRQMLKNQNMQLLPIDREPFPADGGP